jgi:hypothetical protein
MILLTVTPGLGTRHAARIPAVEKLTPFIGQVKVFLTNAER